VEIRRGLVVTGIREAKPMTVTLSELTTNIVADASSDITTSGYYLPFVILSQPVVLDPFMVGDLSFGALSAVSPTLQGTLCNTVQQRTIAPPENGATLQLSDVVIIGLSNVALGTPTVSEGDVTLPLTFGGAAMPSGFSVPSELTLSANFSVDLPCCTGSNGTCSGSVFDTTLGGTLAMTIGSSSAPASATASLSVSPLGTGGTVLADSAVSLTSLTLAADTAIDTTFVVLSPQNANVVSLSNELQTAFNTTSGQSAVVTALNQALNSTALADALGGALTIALPSFVDPPLLATILTIVYSSASNPASSVYLPSAILASTNPVLDPFAAGGPLDLGNMNAINPQGGANICATVGPVSELYINTPNTPLDLTVSEVVVTGLSNIIAAPPLVIQPASSETNQVFGLAALGTLAGWSTQLGISGNYTLSLSCCPANSENPSTCGGPSSQYTGGGTFSATIASAAVSAAVTVGTDENDQLTATVDQVFLHIDPNIVNPQNVVWTLTINADVNPVWITQAQQDFDSSLVTGAIVSQIEASMNAPSALSSLSAILTNTIQNATPPVVAR
jgi:hypothetical protein